MEPVKVPSSPLSSVKLPWAPTWCPEKESTGWYEPFPVKVPTDDAEATRMADKMMDMVYKVGDALGWTTAVMSGSAALWVYRVRERGEVPNWIPGDIDIFVFGHDLTSMKRAATKLAIEHDMMRLRHKNCKTIFDLHLHPDENMPPISLVLAHRATPKTILNFFDISILRIYYPLTRGAHPVTELGLNDELDAGVATLHPLRGNKDPDTGTNREYIDHKMVGRVRKYQERDGITFRIGDAKMDMYGRGTKVPAAARAMINYVGGDGSQPPPTRRRMMSTAKFE